jgi:RNA polymerase sigma factor (sigma-70 family)
MTEPPRVRKNFFLSGIYESFLNSESAIKRYLRRFFHRDEDIDDMAQETFLRAYKYTKHREIDFPKAYLFQVAKSVALKELTKKSRQLTDYIEESCDTDPGSLSSLEEEVMAEQTVAVFCDAIAELPPQCRRVFLMRKYQALSHRQIAEELNISISAVEQHITLGLKRCKSRVDKMDNIGKSSDRRTLSRRGRD